jgi:regulator of nucleoside diphosphate kinase
LLTTNCGDRSQFKLNHHHLKSENYDMKKSSIIMNAADHAELSLAIEAMGRLSERGRSEMTALRGELARAEIVSPEKVPPRVITMNSRAELLDLDTNESMDFTLVFPSDANIEEGKISVLAPLGTAMLGYRVGDEFEWIVPYGRRRLKVTAVHFQPEAALAAAA